MHIHSQKGHPNLSKMIGGMANNSIDKMGVRNNQYKGRRVIHEAESSQKLGDTYKRTSVPLYWEPRSKRKGVSFHHAIGLVINQT